MPYRSITLEVHRPDGRRVAVRVSVLPLLGVRRRGGRGEREMPTAVLAIDADLLEPPSAFLAYLTKLTATARDGAVLHAAIFEPDVGPMLDALGVSGPAPETIAVRLPAA